MARSLIPNLFTGRTPPEDQSERDQNHSTSLQQYLTRLTSQTPLNIDLSAEETRLLAGAVSHNQDFTGIARVAQEEGRREARELMEQLVNADIRSTIMQAQARESAMADQDQTLTRAQQALRRLAATTPSISSLDGPAITAGMSYGSTSDELTPKQQLQRLYDKVAKLEASIVDTVEATVRKVMHEYLGNPPQKPVVEPERKIDIS